MMAIMAKLNIYFENKCENFIKYSDINYDSIINYLFFPVQLHHLFIVCFNLEVKIGFALVIVLQIY